jgi:hypothetical protein
MQSVGGSYSQFQGAMLDGRSSRERILTGQKISLKTRLIRLALTRTRDSQRD